MTDTRQRAAVGRRIRTFYESCSFPGYEDLETPLDLVEKSKQRGYARLLDEQLPLGVRILDAGCGTGQLAIFLSLVHRTVVGADFSSASLAKGDAFRRRFGLANVSFAQMDLFAPALRDEGFDYVFCNGVLHHTADAVGAFRQLVRLVKPGGFIAIGLYNPYGRLFLNLRRVVFRLTGDRFQRLDFFFRQATVGAEKKRIWFMDQYKNPHEDMFSVDDVLAWFRDAGIEYINSVPPIRLGEPAGGDDRLFAPRPPGTRLERILAQLSWIFTQGREGGFFVTFGRKPEAPPAPADGR
jgi:SAM-dependent methyltransferase